MTFVRSSLNPWGDNASANEGHLYLTSLCSLVLNSKHLRTSPQQRPKVTIDQNDKACQKAFSNVCAFIGTRDIVQEHIAYRIWPLVENWDMSRDTIAESTEGGLVRLKYTFRFRDRFDEPNDDWLKSIEAISDELLGALARPKMMPCPQPSGAEGRKD
jgi:hypothetical protein